MDQFNNVKYFAAKFENSWVPRSLSFSFILSETPEFDRLCQQLRYSDDHWS